VLLLLAFQVFLLGLLADLIGRNRRILEESLYRQGQQRQSAGEHQGPSRPPQVK